MVYTVFAYISRYFPIPLRDPLNLYDKVLIKSIRASFRSRVLYIQAINSFTGAITFSLITYVTFPIFFRALTLFNGDFSIKFLPIEAFGVSLSADIGDFLTQETAGANFTVRAPGLVVGIVGIWGVTAGAFWDS